MAAAVVAALASAGDARAVPPAMDAEALAKAAQSPVADVTVLGFQDDLRPSLTPGSRAQNVLAFQPVVPFPLGGAVLVTRTVVPLVWQPTGTGTTFGLGNVQLTAMLGPATGGNVIWAIGATGLFPTATAAEVGSKSTWGLGPSLVVLAQPGHWLFGLLANNVWGISGDPYKALLLQPFVSYNLPAGFFVTSSPTITSDWNATPGNKWRVPIGGGVGKLQMLGGAALHVTAQAFWNAVRPKDEAAYPSAPWELRFALGFVLP